MSESGPLLRLREIRKSRGLSQSALAEAAGIRMASVSDYENGKQDPTARMIARLAKALNAAPHELFASSRGDAVSTTADPDSDLDALDRDALLAAARAMRRAIRAHRDASGHDLCWRHPEMWALLPDPPKGGQVVPDWPQFLRGCIRYRASLDAELPDAPRVAREFGE